VRTQITFEEWLAAPTCPPERRDRSFAEWKAGLTEALGRRVHAYMNNISGQASRALRPAAKTTGLRLVIFMK
jgi:hypothetical protein